MKFEAKCCYHVYNQGNNRQKVFLNDDNYLFFLRKMRKNLIPFCNIMAYCLMPNHFHWLVYIKKEHHPLNRKIGTVISSYTQAINNQVNRTGSLFRQKTKAVRLSSLEYAQTCLHYIHQNPVRAGLVEEMKDWPYSSFSDFIGLRSGSLPSKNFTFQYLDLNKETFAKESNEILDDVLNQKFY
ncbi:MAG TPA: transposase [Balneolaceae bacterium]